MRKVLIVAYSFPPFGGGGVQRTLKFVKYLPDFGWKPVVLTVQKHHAKVHDPQLERESPADVDVYRTPALVLPSWLPWRLRSSLARWVLLVDQQLGWLPYAIPAGLQIIQREGIQAIYTTSAPYSAHLIGLQLKRRTDLPWLADFRDPWVGNFSNRFATHYHERLAVRLERSIVEAADKVTTVSEPWRQAFLQRHVSLKPDDVVTLPNGYDPNDFNGIEVRAASEDRLVIVHNGSLYSPQQTPFSFLEGVNAAVAEGRLPREKVRIVFVGNVSRDIQNRIQELNLSYDLDLTGYQPHCQSIGYLLAADLLLLIIGSGPGGEEVLTGKVYEYLATGKPVLAVVPPGVAADLIQEARAGTVISPDNVAAIADEVVNLFGKWQQGNLRVDVDRELVSRFDRRHLTGDLAHILNQLDQAGSS